VPGDVVQDLVVAEIRRQHPDWNAGQPVCLTCLNQARADHLRKLLEEERGELSALEEDVIASLREQESISENINLQFSQQLTFGDRMADRLAEFGGSWKFIIVFGILMAFWIALNTFWLATKAFDPYPFILLNLALSCLAALQAPIIMMSQNRQEARDRMRAEHDYRVNLKAELEIRLLHAKIDQLLTHQWQRLLEIQQLQMGLMEDIANHRLESKKPPTQK
jgi:uncharacterized membrane protein